MRELPSPWRVAIGAGCTAFFFVLIWAVFDLPDQAVGVGPLALERLDESGVENPVTAVLLNFRAMDTLLELIVLLAAMVGAWSLQVRQVEPLAHPPGLLLDTFVRWLVPALILMAGYLLWAGADHTGGAFQAGAVLGAAGVLWLLTRGSFSRPAQRLLMRVGFTVGIFTFIGVGLAMVLNGHEFLDYPQGASKGLILVIEAASTLSIALILIGLFAGSQRGMEGELAPQEEP